MQVSNAPISASAAIEQTSFHDKISQRAKELWIDYGQPVDRDVGIWLEAEQSLHATAQAQRREDSAPASSSELPPAKPARSSKRSPTNVGGRVVLAAATNSAVKAKLRAK